MELGQYGWNRQVKMFQQHAVFLERPAPATSNYGVLNIGAGPFDGVTSGYFNGHPNGIQFAINTDANFNGILIDCQRGGSKRFLVSSDASAFILNSPSGGSTYGLLNLGPDNFNGSVGDFNGATLGTYLAINAPNGFVGNIADWQVNGVSQFAVSAAGDVTATTVKPTKLTGAAAVAMALHYRGL